MDIVSILSLGTVGLGFLLAVLAYRLLTRPTSNERPIYIFMAFCLVLVGVGAALQFYGSRDTSILSQKDREITDLKKRMEGASAEFNAQKIAVSKNMKTLVQALDRTYEPLKAINSNITNSTVCPGDSSGRAYPKSDEDSDRINSVIAEISSTKQTANQYVQE